MTVSLPFWSPCLLNSVMVAAEKAVARSGKSIRTLMENHDGVAAAVLVLVSVPFRYCVRREGSLCRPGKNDSLSRCNSSVLLLLHHHSLL